MSTYSWPNGRDWIPSRFRMMVMANTRKFTGFYSGQSQAIDLLGEYWTAMVVLPARKSDAIGAAREAFFERLHGEANTLQLYHLQRPAPRGTLRGSPTLRHSAAQLASTINIQTTAGATLLAGDLIGFGGQVSRVMADATADGSGHLDGAEVWPRVRSNLSSGIAVTWDRPLVTFRLADGQGVPVDWMPASVSESIAAEFIEV